VRGGEGRRSGWKDRGLRSPSLRNPAVFQALLFTGVALTLVTLIALAVWALKDTWFGRWLAEGALQAVFDILAHL
jgi:hypothetical protein